VNLVPQRKGLIDDDSVFELGAPEGKRYSLRRREKQEPSCCSSRLSSKEPGDDGNDDGGLDKENGALLKSNVDVQSTGVR